MDTVPYGPEEHEDGWFPEDDHINHPALVAGELDHRIPRDERASLIASVIDTLEEDYSD